MRSSHTMVLTADDKINPAELLNRLRHSVFELFWLAHVGLSSKALPSGGFGQLRRARVQSVKSARPEVSIVNFVSSVAHFLPTMVASAP